MFLCRFLTAFALLCCAAPVLAGEPGAPAQLTFEERLQTLEARQAELHHSLAEKKSAGLSEAISSHVTLSGLLEVEGAATGVTYVDGSSDSASDLILATAQLGFDAKLSDAVGANLIFLYEQGGNLDVDEAAIRLEQGPLFARLGRQYLPFGAFHSHCVSDPLTLVLGETRATALLVGYKHDLATLSTLAFNGVAEKAGSEDHINDWGASLTVTPLAGLEVGGSYLHDLAESNADLTAAPYARRVGGWSAFAHLERGSVTFEAEYLAAARAFAAADLDGDSDGQGDQPRAWNLECAFRPVENLELAARYEGSGEFAGQPQRQYGAAVSWSPWQHTSVALEYLRGEYDRNFAGDLVSGTGRPADRRDLVTMQLAYEF